MHGLLEIEQKTMARSNFCCLIVAQYQLGSVSVRAIFILLKLANIVF